MRRLHAPGRAVHAMAEWARQHAGIKGVVLDISGVLYDGGGDGGGVPIPGSREAVEKIKASGLKLRFCTNETQATRDLVPEFDQLDKANPNCVVIGDAADNFSYKNLSEAFRVLIGLENPILISLGRGRYYKETDGLKLDVGVYMKALEYACDVQAEVVGKPAKMFFQSALAEMEVEPQQAIMIGDDIVNDVGGAQQCGMRALQVRTGKYRPCDEQHPEVKADGQPSRPLCTSGNFLIQEHVFLRIGLKEEIICGGFPTTCACKLQFVKGPCTPRYRGDSLLMPVVV
ncbi:phospholysine phosphohistidine inorganic pyrophosphate phosphatase isoform X2 [Natator depressus]|uniref:phospholysine phosphohistidine inorganic pyrophosphate phosphatase isoform X2 n=1 Tax=Natator depressus TaxID=27790 RepID=UPI003EBB7655